MTPRSAISALAARGILRRHQGERRLLLRPPTYVALYERALPRLTEEERRDLAPTRRERLVAHLDTLLPRLETPARRALVGAVETVVARHAPEVIEGAPGRLFCAGCGTDITDGDCPDVAAFADALLPPEPAVDDGPPFTPDTPTTAEDTDG